MPSAAPESSTAIRAEPIRVLIIDLPTMLREIVRETVAAEPDMVLVGELPMETTIAEGARAADPGVVILGSEHPDVVPHCPEVLARNAQLAVLAVGADGRESFLYELRPRRVALGEVSPRRLVEVIRSSAIES